MAALTRRPRLRRESECPRAGVCVAVHGTQSMLRLLTRPERLHREDRLRMALPARGPSSGQRRGPGQRADRAEVMELITAVRRANVAMDAGNLAAQERLGLSRTGLSALEWLSTHDALLVREIAKELAISTGTASEVIDRLAAKGLVRRAEDPKDGRRTPVSITPKGRREVRSAFRERWDWLNQMAYELSPEQRKIVVQFLGRLHDLMPAQWRRGAKSPAPPDALVPDLSAEPSPATRNRAKRPDRN